MDCSPDYLEELFLGQLREMEDRDLQRDPEYAALVIRLIPPARPEPAPQVVPEKEKKPVPFTVGQGQLLSEKLGWVWNYRKCKWDFKNPQPPVRINLIPEPPLRVDLTREPITID